MGTGIWAVCAVEAASQRCLGDSRDLPGRECAAVPGRTEGKPQLATLLPKARILSQEPGEVSRLVKASGCKAELSPMGVSGTTACTAPAWQGNLRQGCFLGVLMSLEGDCMGS